MVCRRYHTGCGVIAYGSETTRTGYVQDKVREGETGTPVEKPAWAAGYGREGALGYERYAAGAGMRTTAGMQEVE